MKLPRATTRVKAAAIAAVLVGAALPFAGPSPASATHNNEPTCATVLVGDVANPFEPNAMPWPAGLIPFTSGYVSSTRVTNGQQSMINDVNNTEPREWRFRAHLRLASTPAFNAVLNGDPLVQADDSYGRLSVTWRNGRDEPLTPHPAYPAGVAYERPDVSVWEYTDLLPAPNKNLYLAKGTVDNIVPTQSSLASVPAAAIVQTLGSVVGTKVPSADIIAGSMTISRKSYSMPSRQVFWTVYPDAAASDLSSQPVFVATANGALDALLAPFGVFAAVDVNDPDAACSAVGFLYVMCTFSPAQLPAAVAGLCATIEP
jgi:hypothetical protein